MKKQWAIFDWAGNRLYIYGEFKTFEDAWDCILGPMTDNLQLTEQDLEDFYVETV